MEANRLFDNLVHVHSGGSNSSDRAQAADREQSADGDAEHGAAKRGAERHLDTGRGAAIEPDRSGQDRS